MGHSFSSGRCDTFPISSLKISSSLVRDYLLHIEADGEREGRTFRNGAIATTQTAHRKKIGKERGTDGRRKRRKL